MFNDSNYDRIYTGSAIKVNYLKGLLEEAGIKTVVRDDHESQVRAGFNGGYTDQVLLFAEKENLMRARRITEKALEEEEIPEAVLEQQATQSRFEEKNIVDTKAKRPLIKKERRDTRSIFNIVINLALIIYSLWRLSPLLQGEQLPMWRILLSAGILVFCSVTVVNYFRKRA